MFGVVVFTVALLAGVLMPGAAGAVLSMVKRRGLVNAPVLPAKSVWRAVALRCPLASGVALAHANVPLAHVVAQ